MFLHLSVILLTGGVRGWSQGGMHGCSGGCVVAPGGGGVCGWSRGHVWLLWGGAWLLWGGMHGCSQGGMCGCSGGGGACMVALGGVHACSGGACMVGLGGHAWLLPGGMRGWSRGHAWLVRGGMHGWSGGACMVGPRGGMHGCSGGGVRGIQRDTEIRSMSGRYASYWNAFLYLK